MSEEEGVNTTLVIVGALFLAGIIALIAMQLMGMIDIADLGALAENIVYPTYLGSEPMGSLRTTDFDNDVSTTVSTEVSCGIARALKEDFMTYGYDGARPTDSGDYVNMKPLSSARTVVSRGEFRIKWNNNTGAFWNFADLTAVNQDAIMASCTDTTDWYCSTPYVDEECVANALGHFKVGSLYFCTGNSGTNVPITAGGKQVSFGDSVCGSAVADGQDNCKTLCNATSKYTDRITVWRAPGGTGITEYIDDSDFDKGKDWPPFQCLQDKCEPLYAWVLIYNKDSDTYGIDISRMAENKDVGEKTTADVITKLSEAGSGFRDVMSSYAIPELRTRYDVTFKLSGAPTLTEFLSSFTKKLGSGWNTEILPTCFGDECYKSEPIKQTWKKVKYVGMAPEADIRTQESASKFVPKLKKVFVKTNIGEANEPLVAGHQYRVIMRWWRYTLETDWKSPSCNNPTGACKMCWEDEGNYVSPRLERDCTGSFLGAAPNVGGVSFDQYKDVTRYQDYTLIILDESEVMT